MLHREAHHPHLEIGEAYWYVTFDGARLYVRVDLNRATIHREVDAYPERSNVADVRHNKDVQYIAMASAGDPLAARFRPRRELIFEGTPEEATEFFRKMTGSRWSFKRMSLQGRFSKKPFKPLGLRNHDIAAVPPVVEQPTHRRCSFCLHFRFSPQEHFFVVACRQQLLPASKLEDSKSAIKLRMSEQFAESCPQFEVIPEWRERSSVIDQRIEKHMEAAC